MSGAQKDTQIPLAYRYILDLTVRLSGRKSPKILDFGCGPGKLAAYARTQGHDIVGADTYEGIYEDWREKADPSVRDRLHKIKDGRLPFDDKSFDAVLANQVFEHIEDHAPPMREIRRVLKPGGVFVATFPVWETWYEGHAGLYFAHRFARWPRLQYLWCLFWARLGCGFLKGRPPKEWAAMISDVMQSSCFYHKRAYVEDIGRAVWESDPLYENADFMRARLKESRFVKLEAKLPVWCDGFLAWLYLKRAGIVAVWNSQK